jgi:hypothetical protein
MGLRFINIADRLPTELEIRITEMHYKTLEDPIRKRDKKASTKKRLISNSEQVNIVSLTSSIPLPRRERTVDEIKERYYSVARAILVHEGNMDHPIVTKPFNFEAEIRRKNELEKFMMRTRQ